jgi:cell fate (sporulation/competence/biofilm development) regulator YlbF (YheA/YmcA/DUF963 family)
MPQRKTAVTWDVQETTDADVRAAAKAFAAAVAETPEFQAFEQSAYRLRHDSEAQRVIQAFQEKQRSLGMMRQLGALDEGQLAELDRLYDEMMANPTVQAYSTAQAVLVEMCQAANAEISRAVGLDFAASCAPACC